MRGHPRVALDWSFVTPMMGLRVAAVFVLGALFAGCRGPLVPPSQSACGDSVRRDGLPGRQPLQLEHQLPAAVRGAAVVAQRPLIDRPAGARYGTGW
jgi:hypothetical protein